jgi:hypothetical protein
MLVFVGQGQHAVVAAVHELLFMNKGSSIRKKEKKNKRYDQFM